MHPRRVAIVTVISVLLWAVGCHKSQTQSATATSPDGQPAATQAQDNPLPRRPNLGQTFREDLALNAAVGFPVRVKRAQKLLGR